MRDPSEVIAAMEIASDEGAQVNAAVVRMWADELRALSTPHPASADVDDAMVKIACARFFGPAGYSEHQFSEMRAALRAAIKGDSHAG